MHGARIPNRDAGFTVQAPVGLRFSGWAFLAELPANAGMRRLIVHRERVRRAYLQLPPASRQCGYEEWLSFFG